jgi:hypothetical protein
MPERLRTAVNYLRRFVGERRRAPRTPARLPVTVSPHGAGVGEDDDEVPSLEGQTCDLSATGLALRLPAVRIGGRYLTGEGTLLLVTLHLPARPVRLRAAPVRYERLEGRDGSAAGYLVGAHITHMSDEDRALYTEFLRNAARQ